MRNKIRDLREDNNLYQKDIAKLLNVTQQQYSRIEKNENQLSYNKLIKLSNFYKISTDYILGLTNDKKTHIKCKNDIRIKDLRLDNNLYQKDISKLLNVTQPDYSVIETGKSELSYDGLIKLAKFYNTSIDYILGLTNNKEPY